MLFVHHNNFNSYEIFDRAQQLCAKLQKDLSTEIDGMETPSQDISDGSAIELCQPVLL